MKLVAFCAVILFASFYLNVEAGIFGESFLNKTKEISNLTVETSKALAKNAPNYVPTFDELLDFTKQSIAGLPFEAAASIINKICSIAIAANATKPFRTPNASELNYVLLTGDENVTIPLTNSIELWRHPSFNPKKNTVVLITGWTTDINETNTAVDLLSEAYLARGDTNFVFIDTARYVDTLYAWSAFNTQELGEAIGEGLAQLSDFLPDEKIHVIGHSLGAHISGAAGQSYQNRAGKLLPRITGLDPANPCFKEGETLQGLMRGDAEFVDIIHTNCGVLGKRDPIGDSDFYPNGVVPLQPGCLSITCSHARAYELFAETVHPGKEQSLLAKKCNSISSLDNGICKGKAIPVGFACPHNTKGNYFFKTNSEKPYNKVK
ncbi:vitellogenin-3-like [Culicoides brevitarsis]|uniref:vitellogenin-3-like n=1 Tax=Culicoides brevitarsis TaxID=469753 RepID=UPI00307C0609